MQSETFKDVDYTSQMREDSYKKQNIFFKQGTVLCFYVECIVSMYSWVHL